MPLIKAISGPHGAISLIKHSTAFYFIFVIPDDILEHKSKKRGIGEHSYKVQPTRDVIVYVAQGHRLGNEQHVR